MYLMRSYNWSWKIFADQNGAYRCREAAEFEVMMILAIAVRFLRSVVLCCSVVEEEEKEGAVGGIEVVEKGSGRRTRRRRRRLLTGRGFTNTDAT